MKRRDFLKSAGAAVAGGAITAPAILSPAKAQARQETLLIVSESGPNNIDIHGVGTNVPGYEVSWNCYDRLISHEMKTVNGTPYYDRDKFKMELAEDMNVGDMSATFKLKKNAVFHDGSPVTANDVKWSLDRAVTRRRLPDLPDGRRLADQARAVRGGRQQHRPRRLHEEGPADDPRSRGDRAVHHQFRPGEEARHRKGPLGPRIHQAEHRRQRRLSRGELERRHRSRHGALRQMGGRRRRRRCAAWSGAWCRPPATAARCSSAATPTSPTICRTRISRSSRAIGKLSIISTPYSNGIQYLGMNVTKPPFDNPKVRQAVAYAIPYQKIMDAVLFGLSKPMYGAADGTKTEVAWPQPHKFTTDIAKAKQLMAEAGYPNGFETTLSFDLGFAGINEPLCVLTQESLAQIGIKVHDQQDPRRDLAHRAEQEGAAALHQRVLGLARLSGVLLHLVLSRQEFDLQHDELPVAEARRDDRRRGRCRRRRRRGQVRERMSRASSTSPSPTCRASRCSSLTSTSRCRRTCRATSTGSTGGSTIRSFVKG